MSAWIACQLTEFPISHFPFPISHFPFPISYFEFWGRFRRASPKNPQRRNIDIWHGFQRCVIVASSLREFLGCETPTPKLAFFGKLLGSVYRPQNTRHFRVLHHVLPQQMIVLSAYLREVSDAIKRQHTVCVQAHGNPHRI